MQSAARGQPAEFFGALMIETNKADALRWFNWLGVPIEIRKLGDGVTAGVFDDWHDAADTATSLGGNIYATVNQLAVDATNDVSEHCHCVRDADVKRLRHIVVDVDPVRPSGTAATDDQHDAALALAGQIAAEWNGAVVDSGNGAYAVFKTDLEPSDAPLVRRFLEKLASQHDTPTLKIDTSVFNPARVFRVPGTVNCKGPESGHRLARIISLPKGAQ
jgi:hypothetical protein